MAPTILKSVDKPVAAIGEVLTYRITITNIPLGTINNIPFSDVIPERSTYVNNSFMFNSATATPTITYGVITFTILSIAGLGSAVIRFQVTAVGGDDE